MLYWLILRFNYRIVDHDVWNIDVIYSIIYCDLMIESYIGHYISFAEYVTISI